MSCQVIISVHLTENSCVNCFPLTCYMKKAKTKETDNEWNKSKIDRTKYITSLAKNLMIVKRDKVAEWKIYDKFVTINVFTILIRIIHKDYSFE